MASNQISKSVVLTELPVFSCSLLDAAPALLLAKAAVEQLRLQHPQSTPSNVMAQYMSPWKSHLLTDLLNPLIDLVAGKIKEASHMHLHLDLEQLNYDLVVADCWCAVYEQDSFALAHNHFPSDFSCVVYLEMDNTSAPIVFNNDLVVYPEVGTVIFFPGLLPHHVPKTQGKRTVVAINYIKIPKIKMA